MLFSDCKNSEEAKLIWLCVFLWGKAPRLRSSQVPTCRLVQEIGEQAAHDSLVADDQHVLLTLQFHDDRLQPLHEVLVGLSQKRGKSQTADHSDDNKKNTDFPSIPAVFSFDSAVPRQAEQSAGGESTIQLTTWPLHVWQAHATTWSLGLLFSGVQPNLPH